MEQSLINTFNLKNELILKGQIVEATERFFASNAMTLDFDGTATEGKAQMVQKMEGFAGAIAAVKEITLHRTAVGEGVTFAEFTFHFDMKDGSEILWHEIIRSVWEDGLVVNEQYFKNN